MPGVSHKNVHGTGRKTQRGGGGRGGGGGGGGKEVEKAVRRACNEDNVEALTASRLLLYALGGMKEDTRAAVLCCLLKHGRLKEATSLVERLCPSLKVVTQALLLMPQLIHVDADDVVQFVAAAATHRSQFFVRQATFVCLEFVTEAASAVEETRTQPLLALQARMSDRPLQCALW